MELKKNFSFLESLRTNVSLYFPFLAYYHISYYSSPLFPLQEMARLAAAAIDEDYSHSDSSFERRLGLLTVRALVAAAAAAMDPTNIAAGRPIAAWLSDETWMREDWAAIARSGWPFFGALALLQEGIWDISLQRACSTSARQFGILLQKALAEDEPLTPDVSLRFLSSVSEAGADKDDLCSAKDAALKAAAHLAMADWSRSVGLPWDLGQELQRTQVLLKSGLERLRATDQQAQQGGFGALAAFPGGLELLWLLDRLQCHPDVRISLHRGQAFLGAENACAVTLTSAMVWQCSHIESWSLTSCEHDAYPTAMRASSEQCNALPGGSRLAFPISTSSSRRSTSGL